MTMKFLLQNSEGLVSHELIVKTDNLENGITERDIAKTFGWTFTHLQ